MPKNGFHKPYPRNLTYLIAEVADAAMKAVVEPDPVADIDRRTYTERRDLVRFRRALSMDDRLDPARRSLFRRDIARAKLVGELAREILDAFWRLERLYVHGDARASVLSLPASIERSSPSPARSGISRHSFAARA